MDDRQLFELMRGLRTEARNPRTLDIDLLETESVLRKIHAEDRLALEAVEAVLPRWAMVVDLVVDAFRDGHRLYYVGAGTSGRLGILDAAECPPTYGTEPERVQGIIAGGAPTLLRSREGVEDDEVTAREDVDRAGVGSGDVVVGLSASRRTPYPRAALARARARGARTVFVVNNRLEDEDPASIADLVVEVDTGPEAITGSTRMKAGLAQKMLLTLLTTAAMVRWGKVYENLMVDVRPTSAKLRARARGLVMRLGRVDYERAGELLDRCDYEVKTAVVMAHTGDDADGARRRLQAACGRLRPTLMEAGVEVPTSLPEDDAS